MTGSDEQWRKYWEGWYGKHENSYKDWLETKDCEQTREALAHWTLKHDGIMSDAYTSMTQQRPNAALAWTASLLHIIINGNANGISLPAILSLCGDSNTELDDIIWLIQNGWLTAYTMPSSEDIPETFDPRMQEIKNPEDLNTIDSQRVWVMHRYPEGDTF